MKENYLVMKVTIVKEVMKGDVSPVAMFIRYINFPHTYCVKVLFIRDFLIFCAILLKLHVENLLWALYWFLCKVYYFHVENCQYPIILQCVCDLLPWDFPFSQKYLDKFSF